MDVQEVYAIELGSEVDVFAARQGGREVAAAVGMDGQDLVRVARWVECLVFDGEIAYERMVVGLGSRGAALHVVLGPPGPKLL